MTWLVFRLKNWLIENKILNSVIQLLCLKGDHSVFVILASQSSPQLWIANSGARN